jgi:hypothetical protein
MERTTSLWSGDVFAMVRYLAAALLLFCMHAYAAGGPIVTCDACQYNPFDRTIAFNDSLNATYADDPSFASSLRTGVVNSTFCFIAHLQTIRQCSIASEFTETLSVICDTQLHGPAVAKTFDVLNKYQRLWNNSCLASAQQLGTQKFLCMLGTKSVPGELCSLGVAVYSCGSEQGTFVTKSRIVTFNTHFSSVTGWWDTPVFANLNGFLGKTETLQPGRGRAVLSMPERGVSRPQVFDINGRLIPGNSRQGLRRIVRDGKLQVQSGR